MAKITCRVPDCTKKHRAHNCRLCSSQDSAHFSMNCPKGGILYHGTRLSSIKGISYQSLRPSTSGRLGQGVYFTYSLQVAEKISRKRGTGNVAAVFEYWKRSSCI